MVSVLAQKLSRSGKTARSLEKYSFTGMKKPPSHEGGHGARLQHGVNVADSGRQFDFHPNESIPNGKK